MRKASSRSKTRADRPDPVGAESAATPRFVGVDLHKKVATYHIVDASGATLCTGGFDVTPEAIADFAARVLRPGDRVAVEATSNTWAFVRLVRPRVERVVVSNPLKTRAIAEANVKTDKVDARVLAQLLRCDFLPSVWVPTAAVEASRALAARRTALVNHRTAIRNRIHSILAGRLIGVPDVDLFSAKGLAWLEALKLDPLDRLLIESDLALLEAIAKQSEVIEARIVAESYEDPEIRLLMTLPGVDFTTAQALKAALADVGRFATPDRAASYLGLVPSVRQSAERCHHGPITKAGSSQARWLLVQAAQSVGRHPGPLGAFFRKLERRKCRNVAVVATARKLVTIAWHMLKSGEPYRYATPRATDEKLARLRVRATGERRKGGTAPGTKSESKRGGGPSRTIPSLGEVYTRQDVPGHRPLAEGERRMVREQGVEEFVTSLERPRTVPRGKGSRVRQATDPAQAAPDAQDPAPSPPTS